TTPQDLDDVPTGTAERGFKFLNNLAVTTHRPIETLQVTVDHEGEVIQFVICGNVQCTARFWLIHLTVTKECPHVLIRGVLDTAVMNVAVELCLVNSVQRADTHRNCWELPEIIQHFR